MAESLQRAVERLRAQALRAAFVGELSRWTLGGLLGLGTVALLGRLLFDLSAGQAAACLLPLLAVPVVAWRRAGARVPGEREASAWLDVGAGGGGELVLAQEHPDARWSEPLERALRRAPDAPAIRARGPLARVAGGLAFVAAALWIPLSTPLEGAPPQLFAGTVAELQEKLDTLEEELDLEEERRAELEERLAQLARDDRLGREAESLLEALDALEGELERDAEEALAAAERALEQLARAADAASVPTDEAAAEARAALDQALAQLDEGALALPPELAEGLAGLALELPEGAGEAGLDPEALAALSELGEEALAALQERLEALEAAGLLDGLGALGPGADGEPLELADLRELVDAELCEACKNGEP